MAPYKKIIPLGLLATVITLSSNLKSIYSSGSDSIDKKINEIENTTLNKVDKRNDKSSTFLESIYELAANAFEIGPSAIDSTLTLETETAPNLAEVNKTENYTAKALKKEPEKVAVEKIKRIAANETNYSKETKNSTSSTSNSNKSNLKSATTNNKTTANKVHTTNKLASNNYSSDITLFNINEISDYNIQKIAQTYLTQIKQKKSSDKYIRNLASVDNLDAFIESMATYEKTPEEEKFDRTLNKIIKTKNLESSLIDYYVLKASAWQESRFNPTIVSSAGAVGYMQLMKGTYLNFMPGDIFPEDAKIPEKNISAGIDYYLYLIDYIKENHPRADTLTDKGIIKLAVAGYNSGHGAYTHYYVRGKDNKIRATPKPENRRWRIEYMPQESREHVKAIMPKIEEFRNRDILIAYSKEYVQRKGHQLARK